VSFRKEKKFRLSISDSLMIKSKLIKNGMLELHPRRIISSQYFDTKELRMFRESEEGIVPRKKFRIRWYNGDKNNLTYEEKTSSMEGRFKIAKKINMNDFSHSLIYGFFNKEYGAIKPSLLVEYEREYYVYNSVRITFDQNITYKHNLDNFLCRDSERVVEIKAPFNAPEDFLEKIISTPSSRFSKYSRGFLIKYKEL
jgi:hypothetical protein